MHFIILIQAASLFILSVAEPDGQYCAQLRAQWPSTGDADEVESGLWLGNVCSATDSEFLRAHNITFVVNMAREWGSLCTEGGVDWLWMELHKPWRHCYPLDDTSTQDTTLVAHRLEWAARTIRHRRSQGGPVLVHCNAGVSRSTAAVLRYLLDRDARLTYDEALAVVRRARPIARPNALFEQVLNPVDERKRRWKLKHGL